MLQNMELPLTITSALEKLRAGTLTSTDLIQNCLVETEKHDEKLGVFIHRDADLALENAQRIDSRRTKGDPLGVLAGIPLGIKDNIFTTDAPTTGQSLARDPIATIDAPIVARLRAADSVFMGKTTTLEFAFGLNDPEMPFPIPRNPWDLTRWSGGSSSGTASGTQAHMFLGGLGSDTAGSIRMPAAWCGVTGHKPTYGLVPRTGVIPLGWTLDHPGPIARTAEDCALLLSVISGPDHEDRSVQDHASFEFAPIGIDINKLRIGIATNSMQRSVSGVQLLVADAATLLSSLGADVVEIQLPLFDEVVDTVMLGLAAEAFAYHRRETIARWKDFGRSARSALITGALLTSTDYLQTLRVRKYAQRQVSQLFEDVDLIIAPTATQPAPTVDNLDFGEVVGMLQTQYWDAMGNPALSVPMGMLDGLPVGLQITGKPFADRDVLDAGRIWQQHTDHHTKVAPL